MMNGLWLGLLRREWRQRPGRFLLTLGSVAIGTAAVFGALLASASARQAYSDMAASLEGPPALEIVNERGGRFPSADVPDLASVAEIETTVPLVFRASLLRRHERRAKVIVVGTSLERPDIARHVRLRAGVLPSGNDETLLAVPLAEALQVQVADSVSLLTRRGLRKLQVVGLIERESAEQLGAGASVVMPLDAVQELFSLRGQIDCLRLYLRPGVEREEFKAALASRVHMPLTIQVPQGRIQVADELLRSADLALMMACAMAMAMAAFIVLNTVRMNVSERRRQLALLRCVGATAPQIERLVLMEAFVAGTGGALLGVPLGYVFGWGLARGIEEVLTTHIPALLPSPQVTLVPVVSGPLLAVIAAWIPARKTRAISPLEGMRETEPTGYDRFPWWSVAAGMVLWLVGCVCVAGVMMGWFPPLGAIPAALLMLVAYVLWLPVLQRPVLRLASWLIRGRLQLAAQLGCEQLLRHPSRTGLTAGVVVVALNSSVGLGHAILNNVQDLHAWYRHSFPGDYLFQPLSPLVSATPSEDDPLRETLAEFPGVVAVDSIRFLPGRAGDQAVLCIVRDFPANIALPLQLVNRSESQARAALAQGQAIVGNVLARRLGLRPGDSLLVEVSGRSHRFPIGAMASDYFQGGMVLFLERRAALEMFEPGMPDLYSVHVEAAARESAAPALRDLARQYNSAFLSHTEARHRFDNKINGVVGSLWAVVGLTFLASGLGIANTLSVNVLEQTRELGLMRIVGTTARQLRWLILVEAWLLGLLGIALGLSAGMCTAYVTHLCNDVVLGYSPAFAWHYELLVLSVSASLILVSLGAWGPGYRASRLDLLTAIAYE